MMPRSRHLLVLLPFFWVLTPSHAQAQAAEKEGTWAYGYGFAGFGVAIGEELADPLFHLGSGSEFMLGRFGLTGELGYMALAEHPLDGFGTFSPGVLLAFSKRGTVPFVKGGFTLFVRGGTEPGWFVGAGVNFWRSDKFGFRAELNDQVLGSDHLLAARFAVLFR
jgi:hypothetical protein